MPLVSKTFDQLLDFTRTSSATFVGSNGLIQNTAASRNLLLWTQQFDNAAWFKYTSTITANSTVAPDGTSTADTVLASAGTSVDVGVADDALSYVNGQTYTWSVFAKAGTYNFLQLAVLNISNSWANFDLSTGTVGTVGGGTSSIQNVGDGWYRCSMTFTTTATGSNGAVYALQAASASAAKFAKWSPTGTETVFIWGAQLEAASAATTYTRNNGGVFPPRFDYDPVTLAPKGLLVEEQRTNLALRSEEFDNASWNKFGTTVTANAAVSPDGVADADALVEDGTTGSHICQQFLSYTSGTAYTFSLYVKAGTRTWVSFGLPVAAFGAAQGGFYNLSGAGALGAAIGTPTARTITAVGNGWYRITVTATATATAGGNTVIAAASADGSSSYTGVAGAEALYLYGAQLEAGAFATSYMPTVASQVTRTADQCSIVAPNFAPWYNQSEGTLFVDVSLISTAVVDGYSARIVGTNSFIFGYKDTGTTVRPISNSVAGAGVSSVPAAYKSAGAYSYPANEKRGAVNGTLSASTTTGSAGVNTYMEIGGFNATGGKLNGHIRSIRYYPTRLSDSQLQALTA